MAVQIEIQDDFDLEKMAFCGQCFRARKFDDGTYRFLKGNDILYIRKGKEPYYTVSCSEKEWQETWIHYFDLGRDYRSLRKEAGGKHEFVQKAIFRPLSSSMRLR